MLKINSILIVLLVFFLDSILKYEGPKTKYKITDLEANTCYKVKVKAKVIDKESLISEESEFTTGLFYIAIKDTMTIFS